MSEYEFRKAPWTKELVKDGVGLYTLRSWLYFTEFINKELLNYRQYIFRGQAREDWELVPSLDRVLRDLGSHNDKSLRKQHLKRFKLAIRGRMNTDPTQLTENESWALGRHYGLYTPLLDWTDSPFVALFFAFEKDEAGNDEYSVVYGLSENAIRYGNEQAQSLRLPDDADPRIYVIRPFSNDNPRLVSQRGLFTRAPDNLCIKDWIGKYFRGSSERRLIIIRVRNRFRERCLRNLNRMNINHLSLFPDLEGSAAYCNTDLRIENY